MLQTTTIKFLLALKKNNAKEWFDAHRTDYTQAKEDFTSLVQSIITSFGDTDASIAALSPKDCMFRINRDVRFSKNKSPYKTNFGAGFTRGGKKSLLAGYYLHCEPGESFVGGGLWMPMPAELKKIRQEIDYNFDEFNKIIHKATFKSVYGTLYAGNDAKLIRAPKSYEENNPAIEYIKLKSFIATTPISDEELTNGSLLKKITNAFEALQPLIQFLNNGLE